MSGTMRAFSQNASPSLARAPVHAIFRDEKLDCGTSLTDLFPNSVSVSHGIRPQTLILTLRSSLYPYAQSPSLPSTSRQRH
ncbi:uncharacterized protein TRAVEDRAFT_50402 [Trametes versicolor FP-101664 SS1]|uniref:uncharacterized protein n=1 Tax=Trametes versicolor (strain FP-101664) TaxID=717944 RepID=UPI0004623EF4|nr:uncharacterized protein TRAVEDRAFT_50402 [Trametes versicolor FP-101664 SS1]EIW55914.1 hypothetical protein TRAVEDRAFT_50402 [Trametes versicolor FP-101664 SS1]